MIVNESKTIYLNFQKIEIARLPLNKSKEFRCKGLFWFYQVSLKRTESKLYIDMTSPELNKKTKRDYVYTDVFDLKNMNDKKLHDIMTFKNPVFRDLELIVIKNNKKNQK